MLSETEIIQLRQLARYIIIESETRHDNAHDSGLYISMSFVGRQISIRLMSNMGDRASFWVRADVWKAILWFDLPTVNRKKDFRGEWQSEYLPPSHLPMLHVVIDVMDKFTSQPRKGSWYLAFWMLTFSKVTTSGRFFVSSLEGDRDAFERDMVILHSMTDVFTKRFGGL
jgi:hypothetical protein